MKIIDNPEVKTSELINQLKKKFNVFSYWNDEELDKNFLPPKGKTVREFKDEQESSDYKGKSWNEMESVREQMMTFREYIIAFMQYHDETGRYLDEQGWTLFRDSLPGGGAACGRWGPGVNYREVWFCWFRSGIVSAGSGARLAISSSEPSTLNPSLESRVAYLEDMMKKVNNMLILK